MRSRRILLYVTVTVPALVLAVAGLTLPNELTAQSAEYWRNLHIALLPIFPLVGVGPWLVVRGQDAFVSALVGVLGFVYAVFTTSVNVLVGIGAGGLELTGAGRAIEIGVLDDLAHSLGIIGNVALIAAAAVVALNLYRRLGVSALPGSVLVSLGAVLFLRAQIDFPFGVVGQLCLAGGFAAQISALRSPNSP